MNIPVHMLFHIVSMGLYLWGKFLETMVVGGKGNRWMRTGLGDSSLYPHLCLFEFCTVSYLFKNKNSFKYKKKMEIELPYDPAIILLAYTVRKPEFKETHVP